MNPLEEKSCGAGTVPRLHLDAHPASPREPGSKVTSIPSSAGGGERLLLIQLGIGFFFIKDTRLRASAALQSRLSPPWRQLERRLGTLAGEKVADFFLM